GGLLEARLGPVEQREQIPAQAPPDEDGRIREAVDFLHGQLTVREGTEHHAAAFGPQVDGEVVLFHGRLPGEGLEKHYLAIDLGAEGGRVMLGSLADGKLTVEEIH